MARPIETYEQTVATLLADATGRIERSGSDTARLDAEILLAHTLGRKREWLMAHSDETVDPGSCNIFESLVSRRALNEPIAYIIGRQWFRNLHLSVDHRVLIPRPETEFAVEACLAEIARRDPAPVRVVDIGTGSGAIALAIADEAPANRVMVHATDISADALELAQQNARSAGLDRVQFHEGSLLEPVRDRRFEIVVSNPPYVPDEEADSLMPDVVDHEPHTALFTGTGDALSLIRTIINDARKVLVPGGLIVLEIGHDQAEDVEKLLGAGGYTEFTPIPDLQGHLRIVTARHTP